MKINRKMGDPMKRRSGFVSIIIVFIFLMTAVINSFMILPQTGAEDLDKFSDGTSEAIIDFPGIESKFLKIPADSNVTQATLKFTTTPNAQGIYPENIELKLGDMLPIDWAYQGSGHGAFGRQEYFSDSQVRVNLTYDGSGYNDTLSFLLPKDSDVSYAKVKATAFEYDHWEKGITELNIPDSQTWNQDPYPFVFQNRLWVFYRDYNSTQTDQSDGDISYNYTSNGVSWSGATELTPPGDTPDGYPGDGMDHIAGDFHPYPVEFDGKMGVFWGSMSFNNIPSNPWGGITNGSDRDIVAQWYTPGVGWGNYIEITHPTENANESHYTKNTGDDPDPDGGTIQPWHKDDRRPNAVEFNGKIYVIWTANNTGNTTFRMHRYGVDPEDPVPPWWNWNQRGDIMISSSSDGVSWSNAIDLSADDEWDAIDFAPTLCVFNNTLYALWETNGRWYNNSGNWTMKADVQNRFDWDILYRYTTDGVTWSDYYEMTLQNDTANYETRIEYSYPDEDPRMIVFTDPKDNKEKLYCIYRTRNPVITNGTDYDIVYTVTEDGMSWSYPVELTDPETNGGFDNKPELTVFNGKLYAVWRREQGERWGDDNVDGDIVTRHFDGYEWSPRQEVTPFDGDGNGRDDFYPNSVEFNGKFYTTWCTRNRGTGWTQGTDADVVIRSMVPSDLPMKTGLYLGDSVNGQWVMPENTLLTDQVPSKLLDIKSAVRSLMSNTVYVENNTWLDDYGNEFVRINIKAQLPDPGRLRLDDLRIWYNATITVGDGYTKSPDVGENPFLTKINEYIKDNQKLADGDGYISVKLDVVSNVEGRVKMHDIFVNYNKKPTFNILSPAVVPTQRTSDGETGNLTITWNDYDVDDNALISLYYHEGKYKKYDGKVIQENIPEDDLSDSFTWVFNESQVIDGVEYSIFGKITDGVNVIYSYAPGTFKMNWVKPDPPWIKITDPDYKGASSFYTYRIQWDDSGSDSEDPQSGAEIRLFYVEKFCNNETENIAFNATQIDINGNGDIDDNDFIYENEDGRRGSFVWDISDFSIGEKYYITAIIKDKQNPAAFDCSDGRLTRGSHIPPADFKVMPGTQILEVDASGPNFGEWETHSRKPQLTWKSFTANDRYFLTVWRKEGTTQEMILEEKNLTIEGNEVTDDGALLAYGTSYYAEVYAVSYTSNARSPVVYLNFSVVNNIPEEPEIKFQKDEPTSSQGIVCLEPDKTVDEDGDSISYSYKWYKLDENGVEVHMEKYDNLRTIPADATTRFDVWKVRVTPSDGIVDGITSEATIIIRNSLPTITKIERPDKSGAYYHNENVFVHATVDDLDGDELTIEWYLDVPDPTNMSTFNFSDLIEEGTSKFDYKFPVGQHTLTLYVTDEMELDYKTRNYKGAVKSVTFTVEKGTVDKEKSTPFLETTSGALTLVFIPIIVIVVIVLFFLFLKKRKPKTEREKIYGTGMGLKPGEAYPVEDESGDKYFGDELDRKGVDSLQSSADGLKPADQASVPVPAQQSPPMAGVKQEAIDTPQKPMLPPASDTKPPK